MSKNRNRGRKPQNVTQHPQRGIQDRGGALSINTLNLLIERKVDDGVKDIRKKIVPYFIAIIVSAGFGMWGCYVGLVNDIKERLTSAYVANALNEHITKFTDEKVSNVADGRIAIAEKRIISGFEKKVSNQEAMLEKSSAKAESQIQLLRSALEVMKKAYDARGGDRRAFDEIASLSTNTTEAGEMATRVIREIEASYSERKEKERLGFTSSMRHHVSYNGKNGKHGPISFADAALLVISHNRDFEEGAIYRLADSRQKEFVEILMLSVGEAQSLNAVYVALRSIEKLSGASFPVLGVAEAKDWWESNKEKPEYHSPYKTALTIFVNCQMQIQSNESESDYYKRVVIPIHDAVVAKPDLEIVVKAALPIAFAYGLELRGKMEGVDCLKITKDLISHLGKDEDARRMAFRYTINTMALYENRATKDLLNFIVRSIKAHPDYLQVFEDQKAFTPEFKKLVEDTVKTLEEHTKGISSFFVLNQLTNGDMELTTAITDDKETLHDLKLIVTKSSTFIVSSANNIEIPPGEVGCINFESKHKKGRILLLNNNGSPVIFDLQTDSEKNAVAPSK